MVIAQRTRGVALGLLGDLALGDPPTRWHPVGWFGAAMTTVERRVYRDDRAAGAVYAGIGIAIGAGTSRVCRSGAAATAVCSAGRGLVQSAHAVADRLDAGDLDGARERLSMIVGRDPTHLDCSEIARAVVETVAENTVDAIVAPTCWALAAGARGAFVHRAINTMDAMVGHRTDRYERFGWAAARLDDGVAWVPARLTAALVATVRPAAGREVLAAVRRDAPAHPSPNSGVAEAAYAAALGIRLGGANSYAGRVEARPVLGAGRAAEPADIRRATALCRDVTLALIGGLLTWSALERARR